MNVGYTIPNAEANILAGIKIHTFRDDPKDRWKPGLFMHHATGIRSKRYRCFLKNQVVSIQKAVIKNNPSFFAELEIYIDGRLFKGTEVNTIAVNDGFRNAYEFKAWFFKIKGCKEWTGKLLHWTDKKY